MERGQIEVVACRPVDVRPCLHRDHRRRGTVRGISVRAVGRGRIHGMELMPRSRHGSSSRRPTSCARSRPLSVLCQYPDSREHGRPRVPQPGTRRGVAGELFQAAPVEGGLAVAGELDATNQKTLRHLLDDGTRAPPEQRPVRPGPELGGVPRSAGSPGAVVRDPRLPKRWGPCPVGGAATTGRAARPPARHRPGRRNPARRHTVTTSSQTHSAFRHGVLVHDTDEELDRGHPGLRRPRSGLGRGRAGPRPQGPGGPDACGARLRSPARVRLRRGALPSAHAHLVRLSAHARREVAAHGALGDRDGPARPRRRPAGRLAPV